MPPLKVPTGDTVRGETAVKVPMTTPAAASSVVEGGGERDRRLHKLSDMPRTKPRPRPPPPPPPPPVELAPVLGLVAKEIAAVVVVFSGDWVDRLVDDVLDEVGEEDGEEDNIEG